MKRRLSNATLLGLFLVATVGSGAQARGQNPAAEGQWGPILNWELTAINMIVLKNGKVLAFEPGAGAPAPVVSCSTLRTALAAPMTPCLATTTPIVPAECAWMMSSGLTVRKTRRIGCYVPGT